MAVSVCTGFLYIITEKKFEMEVKNQLQCVIGKKAKEYSVSQVITPMQ
jgi:hypothetical protein